MVSLGSILGDAEKSETAVIKGIRGVTRGKIIVAKLHKSHVITLSTSSTI
jgi:hypothetical protein